MADMAEDATTASGELASSFVSAAGRRRSQTKAIGGCLRADAAAAGPERSTRLFRALLLLGGLLAYSGVPLAINFSVAVRVPSHARFVDVPLPALRSDGAAWLGVDLARRDGVLFVEGFLADGLAEAAGVMQGDVVAQVVQNGAVLFKRGSGSVADVKRVQRFLESGASRARAGADLGIDPSGRVEVRFEFGRVEVQGGAAYLSSTPLLLAKLWGWCFCSVAAAGKGWRELRCIYSPYYWWCMAPAIIIGYFGLLFEAEANRRLPALLYSVLARLVLIGTAMFKYVWTGQKHTLLQVSLLLGLTLVIISYAAIPDVVPSSMHWNGFGEPINPESTERVDINAQGLTAVSGYIIAAVVSLVFSEKAMKGPALANESMIVVQGIISTIGLLLSVAATAFTSSVSSDWEHGVFGGEDVRFWHCGQDESIESCKAQIPVAIVLQGWDWRTVALAFTYVFREVVLNNVTREFNSIVRLLVSSASVALTYSVSVLLLDKPFNATKCLLLFALTLSIHQYTMSSNVDHSSSVTAAKTETPLDKVEHGSGVSKAVDS